MTNHSFLQKIKTALSDIITYLAAQKIVFTLSVLAFIAYSLAVFDAEKTVPLHYGFFENLCKALALAAVCAIPASLISAPFSPLKKYAVQLLCAAAGGVFGYFAISDGFGDGVYAELYYFGIGFAVIAAALFLFIPKNGERIYFALVFKHFLFCSLMTIILCGGLCLLVFAVQNLILNTNSGRVYACCVAFSFFVFAINSFSFHLFYRQNERSSGKAFKIITLYILCPIFAVLLLILYAYLFKALILLTLPNGHINWFVSFASLFYLVFYFILREYDEIPVIRVFYRFGAFAFIPLILVQIPAFFIRVNAYGFTGSRVASLLFIIFSVISIALTLIKKGAFAKYALLLLSLFILFGSVTPFNLIKTAHKNQFERMMSVLDTYALFDHKKNSLTDYDRAELERTISDSDREKLYGSWYYLTHKSDIPLPKWLKDKDGFRSFHDLFGIHKTKDEESEQLKEFAFTAPKSYEINISGFKTMQAVSAYEYAFEWENGEKINYKKQFPRIEIKSSGDTFDATDFLLSLNAQALDYLSPVWFYPDDNTALCFMRISYKYNTELRLFKHFEYSAYLFRR